MKVYIYILYFYIFKIDNHISYEGVIEFSKNLKYVSKLKGMFIPNINMENKGIKELSENLKYLPNLESLSIANNGITDEGMDYVIRELGNCPDLNNLWIFGNDIKDFNETKERILQIHPNTRMNIYMKNEEE